MNDIEVKIRELIDENIETTDPISSISNDDDLFQHGMDSISAIKLIVAIESVYDFEFDEEDLNIDNVRTIMKISQYIKSRIKHEE